MKRREVLSGSVVIVALIAVGTLAVADVPARPKVTKLMQVSLAPEFTPGREVLMDVVEIPPNGSLERHWHPGEEFHYYLEGEVEIRLEGQPSIIGKPGTVGHVPFKKRHQAIAGPKGAKILVYRVHTPGQPWRYADEPAAK